MKPEDAVFAVLMTVLVLVALRLCYLPEGPSVGQATLDANGNESAVQTR